MKQMPVPLRIFIFFRLFLLKKIDAFVDKKVNEWKQTVQKKENRVPDETEIKDFRKLVVMTYGIFGFLALSFIVTLIYIYTKEG